MQSHLGNQAKSPFERMGFLLGVQPMKSVAFTTLSSPTLLCIRYTDT